MITGTRTTKRGRPVTEATLNLRRQLVDIVAREQPATVRAIFYQAASVEQIVPKTEAGYRKVARELVKMRELNMVPWSWITDATRWRRGATTYDSVQDALEATARLYRRNLWDHSDTVVECWIEKEALAGAIVGTTAHWTVDLMVCKGYPSRSFLHGAAMATKTVGKPLTILYLGDHDPSGKDIPDYIRRELKTFGVPVDLRQLAVQQWQIEAWSLPTRPTKATDTRARRFSGDSVELDAIGTPRLRRLLDEAIKEYVDFHEVGVIEAIEEHERDVLRRLAGGA